MDTLPVQETSSKTNVLPIVMLGIFLQALLFAGAKQTKHGAAIQPHATSKTVEH
jgi:hypothetical protein